MSLVATSCAVWTRQGSLRLAVDMHVVERAGSERWSAVGHRSHVRCWKVLKKRQRRWRRWRADFWTFDSWEEDNLNLYLLILIYSLPHHQVT